MALTTAPSGFVVDAMLCDSAVTAEGKLFLQGAGWNMITPSDLPARVARVGLGVVVTVPYNATNRTHDLQIELQHEDGEKIPFGPPQPGPNGEQQSSSSILAQFNMGRPPVLLPGEGQVLPFAVNLDGMEFARAGAYAFVFEINGEELRRLSFRVLATAQQNLGIG